MIENILKKSLPEKDCRTFMLLRLKQRFNTGCGGGSRRFAELFSGSDAVFETFARFELRNHLVLSRIGFVRAGNGTAFAFLQ